jgi:hypothetical protein
MRGMLKYLRIAVSAICLPAFVLLFALWVRSYGYTDTLEKRTSSRVLQLQSFHGCLTFRHIHPGRNRRMRASDLARCLDIASLGRTHISSPISDRSKYPWEGGVFGFGRRGQGAHRVVFAPYWCPVVLTGTLGAILWIPWSRRFSLRTLLIATTLVAMGLGIIVVSS